ncbi:MAG: NirD/YgiW/YdeI family stress tolerance protein [Aeromonas sp.]
MSIFANRLTQAALSTALLCASSYSSAAFTGPEVHTVITSAQVAEQADDSWITLEGHITAHLGGERYLFKDGSGTLEVEIERDEWRGIDVSPRDAVRLRAEVDKSWRKTEVEVGRLELIQAPSAKQGGFIK